MWILWAQSRRVRCTACKGIDLSIHERCSLRMRCENARICTSACAMDQSNSIMKSWQMSMTLCGSPMSRSLLCTARAVALAKCGRHLEHFRAAICTLCLRGVVDTIQITVCTHNFNWTIFHEVATCFSLEERGHLSTSVSLDTCSWCRKLCHLALSDPRCSRFA